LSGDGNIDINDDNNDPTDLTGYPAAENTGDSGDNNNDEHSSYSDQRTPERWVLVLAITILAFGVTLLALRSVIFSLILITIGISLFAWWLYVGVRLKEGQDPLRADYTRADYTRGSFTMPGAKEKENVCTCPVCKHTESKPCMERKCPCCILTRNKRIIGHFNKPLE
jgi:hypothetical protein